MNAFLGALALTTATAALLALPIAPALLELRQRRDAAALATQQHDGNIRNFAQSFRRYIEPLRAALAECAATGETRTVLLSDGGSAILVGGPTQLTAQSGAGSSTRPRAGRSPTPTRIGESMAKIEALVLCQGLTSLPDHMIFAGDLYAADTLEGGELNVYRAILGESDIVLGPASQVLRWIHAEQTLYAERNTVLYGRASAEHAMYLGDGCRFERIFAPRIYTFTATNVTKHYDPEHQRDTPMIRGDLPEQNAFRLPRQRIKGKLTISAGDVIAANLIAEDQLRISGRVHIHGSIKGHADIEIGEDTRIDGSIVAMGKVIVGKNCLLHGPVLAERSIAICRGVQIGTLLSPSTVSAPRIAIAPGVILHGSLWAREGGYIGV